MWMSKVTSNYGCLALISIIIEINVFWVEENDTICYHVRLNLYCGSVNAIIYRGPN